MDYIIEVISKDLLIHFAFLLTALAYITYDMLFLRVLAVCSSLVGLGYFGIYLGQIPVLFWQILFLGINSWRIIHLLRERRGVSFSEEEQELY